MNTQPPTKAVIYCRTATDFQQDQIDQQEALCRSYAEQNELQVVAVFQDVGMSGNTTDRPSFKNLLNYLADHAKSERYAVIVSDLSRLARSPIKYLELKEVIHNLGGDLQIAGLQGKTPADTSFIETVLAATTEHADALDELEMEEYDHAD